MPVSFAFSIPGVPAWLTRSGLRNAIGLQRLEHIAEQLSAITRPAQFARAALARLGVSFELDAVAGQIPPHGPVIFTANHPFGGIDGLIAIATLSGARPDLKVLANSMLQQLPALRDTVLPVNPFGGAGAVRMNAAAVRQAMQHLRSGGALLLFPAGEVSQLLLHRGVVADPAWQDNAARLIRRSAADVVPMHFTGRNSALFQCAGLLHPRLRTALLPRELLNKRGLQVRVRLGERVPAARLAELPDAALCAYLRLQSYALHAPEPCVVPSDTRDESESMVGVAAALSPNALERDIAGLGDGALVAQAANLQVYLARAAQIPAVLSEIGRLRELTFRAVGEGTGAASDLDQYDAYYEHLFVWHPQQRQIVGAYRLGRVDEILKVHGRRGLYLASLFEFRDPFFALLGPAIELGRSFVRQEYQRSFLPLLLLWKGIGAYIGRHPRYLRLLGAASVSASYDELSRAMLMKFLRRRRFDPLLAGLVRARSPFLPAQSLRSVLGDLPILPDLEQVGAFIASREQGRQVPVLLRQYLRLGARVLGFNVDAQFSHALDCLILLDLRRADPELLQKYMTAPTLDRLRRLRRRTATDAAVA